MSKKHLRPSTVLGVCSLSALAIAAGCSGQGDETLGTTRAAALVSPDLVISQVYGGGQSGGATYKSDFVELFNRGSQDVDLGGTSLQYASATGNFATGAAARVELPAFSLAPGKYFLVRLGTGDSGLDLPTPDHTATIGVQSASAKIALVPSDALLSSCGDGTPQCPDGAWIDFVGFGANASQAEGTKTPNLSTTTAAIRKSGGCTDTGNNAEDFDIAAPTPRNSASPANLCASAGDGGTTDDAGDAGADGGDTDIDAGAELDAGAEPDAGPAATLVLLNEVKINPPGDSNTPDAPWEYAEVLCTPGASLDGYYFVALEGDGDSSSGSPGVADLVVSLAGKNCGSNGLAYIKAAAGGHPAGAAATTVITSTALDTGTSPLENATTSFVIVKSPSAVITATTDYDADDDGDLELPSGASIVDGISVFQESNNVTDHTYAPRLTIAAGPPDGATRLLGNTTAMSANAWYGGDLAGSSPDGLAYDATKKTANTPNGAELTPGAPNHAGSTGPKPDAGSSSGGPTTPDPDPDTGNTSSSSGGRPPASSSGAPTDGLTTGGDSGCAVTTAPGGAANGLLAALGGIGLALLGIRRRRA